MGDHASNRHFPSSDNNGHRSNPPVGAHLAPDGTWFRVWAAGRKSVSVVLDTGERHPLTAEPGGYFGGLVRAGKAGDHYWFEIDGRVDRLPDPASRWQPEGPQGPSVICTPDNFAWTDQDWPGITRDRQVLYELHIGTFTQEGTWRAAAERLETLSHLGITTIQVMPIAEFGGAFGWGYDTLLHYAPSHLYGTPDDLRAFIDRAHAIGLGIILDVVYNHVGIGDHFRDFSDHYFADRQGTEWGAGFNFDGEQSAPVREFVVENAAYWIRDFHFDGLRLDATQALFDTSAEHIIAEITRATRKAAGDRSIYLVAENQPEDRRLIEPATNGGYGLDALANDDFHHAAHVALTGHNDFYYRDYLGTPQELVSSLKYGFLYQGQRSDMRAQSYGTFNLDSRPQRFVHFLENHDQIANSARGLRLSELGSAARIRALTALLLLGPQTPCLFQGQEFGASGSFHYFAGYDGPDAEAVRQGRIKSLSNFPSVRDPAMTGALADPVDRKTFGASKLDWSEFDRHAPIVRLHRDLLAMRRNDPAFAIETNGQVDGAVLADAAFLIRYFTPSSAGDRLLLVNLGRDLPMAIIPEPLLAPPPGQKWTLHWSSEDPAYGGTGRPPLDTDQFWVLPADTALILAGEPRQPA